MRSNYEDSEGSDWDSDDSQWDVFGMGEERLGRPTLLPLGPELASGGAEAEKALLGRLLAVLGPLRKEGAPEVQVRRRAAGGRVGERAGCWRAACAWVGQVELQHAQQPHSLCMCCGAAWWAAPGRAAQQGFPGVTSPACAAAQHAPWPARRKQRLARPQCLALPSNAAQLRPPSSAPCPWCVVPAQAEDLLGAGMHLLRSTPKGYTWNEDRFCNVKQYDTRVRAVGEGGGGAA